jgi:hypothetical protein
MQLARSQWDRYENALRRGHIDYQNAARRNEDFYLGDGRQWDDQLKETLEAMGKPWLEENIIFSTINTVLGYQTQSRMDIAFKPRGEGGDQEVSDILSKIALYVIDSTKYPWTESQAFADGIIQQRGYLDIRMNFDNNLYGNIEISSLDPLDVIPDPDAKSYNPNDWKDVLVTKWMHIDDIRTTYGSQRARDVVGEFLSDRMDGERFESESDFGQGDWSAERNKFGRNTSYLDQYYGAVDEDDFHVRLLERQWYKLELVECFYDITSGDYIVVPENMKPREVKRFAKAQGYEVTKKLKKRVRWTVSTRDTILHDDWSPYEDFTIVPYFPYFRRGVTVGLVDNLVKTQEMINKVFSQILHTVNTTANSGWIVEQNSLTNMTVEELEEQGGQTGLVLEHKTGRAPPSKIEPNQIPTGLKDLVGTGFELMRMISGVSESFQGGKSNEVSGVAIQSRVHQSAIQLATPIDNLFRTRYMIAERLLKLIQQFYTEERVFYITSPDPAGKDKTEAVAVNKELPNGAVLNDLTVGEYDVVIADVPTQVTFQNAQFQQALEMRKFGVQIPDDEMVIMSTLSRKNDIAKKMNGEASEEAMMMQQEQMRLQMSSLSRQVEKLEAETKIKEAETMAKAAEVAQILATTPAIAPVLDRMLAQIKNEATENEKGRNQESPQAFPAQEGPEGPEERQEMLNPSLGMM